MGLTQLGKRWSYISELDVGVSQVGVSVAHFMVPASSGSSANSHSYVSLSLDCNRKPRCLVQTVKVLAVWGEQEGREDQRQEGREKDSRYEGHTNLWYKPPAIHTHIHQVHTSHMPSSVK